MATFEEYVELLEASLRDDLRALDALAVAFGPAGAA